MSNLQSYIEEVFSQNPELCEIFFNGIEHVVGVQANGHYLNLAISPFHTKNEMIHKLQRFSFEQGLRLDPLCPSSGGDLTIATKIGNSSYRWHILLPPSARDGPLVTIRKMNMLELSISNFVSELKEIFNVIKAIFIQNQPILICGPTGSGKTTFLTRLLLEYCNNERLLIIEHSPEIPRLREHWLRVCAQRANADGLGEISVSRLIEESLRLRADRVIIGEILGKEAEGLFRALQTSDRAPIATLHTRHPSFLIDRLSDISKIAKRQWIDLFNVLQPCCIQLERKDPRLAGVYRFEAGEFKVIYSSDQT